MAKALMPAAFGLVGIDHMAEARAHDDGHVGPESKDLFRKLDARHLRHGLVRDDEVEPGGVLLQEREGLPAARPGCHLVAEFREDVFTHLHEGFFVIDEEDALGAGGELVVTDRIGFGLSCNLREIDGEGGALAGFTLTVM